MWHLLSQLVAVRKQQRLCVQGVTKREKDNENFIIHIFWRKGKIVEQIWLQFCYWTRGNYYELTLKVESNGHSQPKEQLGWVLSRDCPIRWKSVNWEIRKSARTFFPENWVEGTWYSVSAPWNNVDRRHLSTVHTEKQLKRALPRWTRHFEIELSQKKLETWLWETKTCKKRCYETLGFIWTPSK